MTRRRLTGLLGCCLAVALGGCSFGAPEPIPLQGPTPRTILVLPVKPSDPPGDVGAALLATIGPALFGRGYYPIPIELGFSELESLGLGGDRQFPVEQYAAAAREIGADAFLSIRVEEWYAMYAPNLVHLSHDIGYRLWDSATGAMLWELRSRDSWDWNDDDEPYFDSGSELDSYLGPVQRGEPSSPYRDDVDAARAIQRRALSYLPAGEVR